MSKIYNKIILKIILLSIAFILCAVNPSFGAITFTYDESDNKVVVTEGTSETPATFADFVTADRAGTAELTPEDAPVACTTNITLTYQIRPVEDLALQITFTLASTSAGAGDTLDITGTDWRGAAQNESIDVSGGDGAYTGAKYWRTITDIDCTGWADGTLKVTQPQWGVIWDYNCNTYKIDCDWDIGDGSTSTYFADTHKILLIDDIKKLETKANSTFKMGTKDGSYAGYNGGMIAWVHQSEDSMAGFDLGWDGIVLLYGVKVCDLSGTAPYLNADIDIGNASSEFINVTAENINSFSLESASNVYGYRAYAINQGLYVTAAATLDNIEIRKCKDKGISLGEIGADSTIQNIKCYDNNNFDISLIANHTYWLKFVNSEYSTIETPDPDHIYWDGYFYEAYTCNIHITDKDGANLAGVSVACEDTSANAAFTTQTTAADGTITQQTINYNWWVAYQAASGTYSPHKFTLSKAGYETLVLDNITVDGPIDWHLELQAIKMPPAPFFGDLKADDYFYAKVVNE